jgi:ATP-binding cassette subfamily F protein 3
MPGYFSQNQAETLDEKNTVLDETYSVDETATLTRIRTLLGCFLFRGEDVFKPIAKLSGGERSRLALAKLLLKPYNLLLLDEPTNHLDLGAKEELAEALEAFDGTAVLISHDRYFLDRVATHVLHIERGQATLYIGNYSYYMDKREEERLAALEAARMAEEKARGGDGAKPSAASNAKPGKMSYKQEKALAEAEQRVIDLEARLSALEEALANPETYQDGDLSASMQTQYAEVKDALEEANMTWLELADQVS